MAFKFGSGKGARKDTARPEGKSYTPQSTAQPAPQPVREYPMVDFAQRAADAISKVGYMSNGTAGRLVYDTAYHTMARAAGEKNEVMQTAESIGDLQSDTARRTILTAEAFLSVSGFSEEAKKILLNDLGLKAVGFEQDENAAYFAPICWMQVESPVSCDVLKTTAAADTRLKSQPAGDAKVHTMQLPAVLCITDNIERISAPYRDTSAIYTIDSKENLERGFMEAILHAAQMTGTVKADADWLIRQQTHENNGYTVFDVLQHPYGAKDGVKNNIPVVMAAFLEEAASGKFSDMFAETEKTYGKPVFLESLNEYVLDNPESQLVRDEYGTTLFGEPLFDLFFEAVNDRDKTDFVEWDSFPYIENGKTYAAGIGKLTGNFDALNLMYQLFPKQTVKFIQENLDKISGMSQEESIKLLNDRCTAFLHKAVTGNINEPVTLEACQAFMEKFIQKRLEALSVSPQHHERAVDVAGKFIGEQLTAKAQQAVEKYNQNEPSRPATMDLLSGGKQLTDAELANMILGISEHPLDTGFIHTNGKKFSPVATIEFAMRPDADTIQALMQKQGFKPEVIQAALGDNPAVLYQCTCSRSGGKYNFTSEVFIQCTEEKYELDFFPQPANLDAAGFEKATFMSLLQYGIEQDILKPKNMPKITESLKEACQSPLSFTHD